MGAERSPDGREWRWISDAPSYMVSSWGDVRRRKVNAKMLKGDTDPKGYRRVLIHGKHMRVARLVCEAFHGPCPRGHECAHLDGNKDNNSATNLAWVTRSENTKHSILHGTYSYDRPSGARHPSAKLTEIEVREIRKKAAAGASRRALAAEYGISSTQAHRIIKQEKWANV